ncbi:hypothetical protein DICVIV_00441 [Dictyocaulus viviparus]|uniref:C3H1-type domain-containing protein n=1 Tax=Dictyocaulus viviparus TaxID=29172 RepID=A0A0D8Y906_DICVI|nr:hypothetical protein DICVIV_00441 [Dictyocaulus viviparus]
MKQNSIRSPISTPRNTRRRPIHSFETILCESWKRGETCKFGQYCWFAHGPLQLPTTNDNYPMNTEMLNGSKLTPIGKRMFHSSVTQLTPEQQQWILLSQHAQHLINLPHILLAAHYKDILNASTYIESKVSGRTCEELERQQTAVHPSFGAVHNPPAISLFIPVEQLGLSVSCTDCSPLSGPSTPVSYNTWLQSSLNGSADKAFSIGNLSFDDGVDETIQKSFIPFEKQELILALFDYSSVLQGNVQVAL